MSNANNFPKLHNATWPGVVGKGVPGAEPFLSLVEMLDLTKGAEVDGVKFDGFDLFLAPPHFDCDKMDAEVEQIVKYCSDYGFDVGSFVANVWAGSAMGDESARATFLAEVDRACQVGQKLRKAGVRPYGCVRIDSSCSVDAWSKDPDANSKTIVDTFKKACDDAEKYGETLAMEGEVCWGGMHSWKRCLQVLESVDRPGVLGLQADMSHTNLFLQGANAPEDRLLPEDFQWGQTEVYDEAYKIMTDAHDKSGRHCLPKDPNGKLDIPKYAKFWLTENGVPTKKLNCVCWDGCMFPNAAMKDPQTWNDVLGAMVEVRAACGWTA